MDGVWSVQTVTDRIGRVRLPYSPTRVPGVLELNAGTLTFITTSVYRGGEDDECSDIRASFGTVMADYHFLEQPFASPKIGWYLGGFTAVHSSGEVRLRAVGHQRSATFTGTGTSRVLSLTIDAKDINKKYESVGQVTITFAQQP